MSLRIRIEFHGPPGQDINVVNSPKPNAARPAFRALAAMLGVIMLLAAFFMLFDDDHGTPKHQIFAIAGGAVSCLFMACRG